MSQARVQSPCIGVCSTGIGDTVCRGCKRYCHEIIQWNGYSDAERRAIYDRLQTLLTQVVKARVIVTDERRLRAQIEHQRIRFDSAADPYCWVFDLLKAGAGQISDMEAFGCRPRAEFTAQSPGQLRDAIDRDFYVLSSVHYQRYFRDRPMS